ncbi:MAG: hypothetical protein GX900_06570 [Clostridiaceae bacterium]|jgi:hypothetical protein|nr:hypothetical protein [Clostridiaceae bacterium]
MNYKINWRQKFSSSKFWSLLVVVFMSTVARFISGDLATRIATTITRFGALVIYILSESTVDAARAAAGEWHDGPISWRQKLSSRKLWALLDALIAGAIDGLVSPETVTQILSAVGALGAMVAYFVGDVKINTARLEVTQAPTPSTDLDTCAIGFEMPETEDEDTDIE